MVTYSPLLTCKKDFNEGFCKNIVEKLNSINANIYVEKTNDNRIINAKSVSALLSLNIKVDDTYVITVFKGMETPDMELSQVLEIVQNY